MLEHPQSFLSLAFFALTHRLPQLMKQAEADTRFGILRATSAGSDPEHLLEAHLKLDTYILPFDHVLPVVSSLCDLICLGRRGSKRRSTNKKCPKVGMTRMLRNGLYG